MTRWMAGAAALMIAAAALCVPALYNGQPFLFPDTAGYVRSVDFAIVKLISPKLATEWARGAAYSAAGAETAAARPLPDGDAAAPPVEDDRNVWRGRSVYYGALAYLGYVLGGFWPTIVVHGLLLAFTASLFLRHGLGLRSSERGAVLAAAAALTPAGAYVCYVTADVLGGVALMAVASVFAFHRRMSRLEITSAGVIVAYCATTHMASLATLLVATAGGAVLVSARAAGGGLMRRHTPTAVIGAALMAAIAADAASGLAVKTLVGRAPLTLPFAMAQLVEDGPGARLMQERCHELDFAVCAFTHVLPMEDSNMFLFSRNEDEGVIKVADAATQRAIVDEQFAFLLEVIKTYPVDTLRVALDNWWTQLNMFEINEFNYVPVQIEFFDDEQLPDTLYARLIATPAYNGDVPTGVASVVFTAMFWPSMAGLLAALAMTAARRPLALRSLDIGLLMVVGGVAVNAAVCGIIAGPYDRFGGRAAWAVPVVAMAGAVALWRDGWGARVRQALGLGARGGDAAAPALGAEA